MFRKALNPVSRNYPLLYTFSNRGFFSSVNTFYKNDLIVSTSNSKKKKNIPKFDKSIKFGSLTTEHMLEIDWDKTEGWTKPKIVPYHTFQLDPCNITFHYATECFEGIKAFHGVDGKIRLFRPESYLERFREACKRMTLPDFDEKELLGCIEELVKIDKKWIPPMLGYSLYIRPVCIGMTNVLGVRRPDKAKLYVILMSAGPYFPDGFKPLKIYTESKLTRAYPGGIGEYKAGANYAPTIQVLTQAEKKGYHQVLWLVQNKITEIGASNFFFAWNNKEGEKELVTAPLDGLVLPGVIRDSVLTLAREQGKIKVSERAVTIQEFIEAIKERRLLEAFAAGTTITFAPIGIIHYAGTDYEIPIQPKVNAGPITKDFFDQITNIQYGKTPHPWSKVIIE